VKRRVYLGIASIVGERKTNHFQNQALADGVALVNDMTENQLLVLIKEKNYPAISFWLRHRNNNYKNKIEVTGSLNTINELSPEQEILVKKALNLAGVETYEENK
jgi:hypothetical protein